MGDGSKAALSAFDFLIRHEVPQSEEEEAAA
jgi:alkyl hydroperoxide reductase subunit F